MGSPSAGLGVSRPLTVTTDCFLTGCRAAGCQYYFYFGHGDMGLRGRATCPRPHTLRVLTLSSSLPLQVRSVPDFQGLLLLVT